MRTFPFKNPKDMEHNTIDKLCQFHDSQGISENQDLVNIWVSHSDSMEFWLSVEVQFSYWLGLNHHHHHVRKVLNRGLQLQLKCTLLIDCLRCCWFEVRFRLVALPSPCQDYIPQIGSDLLRCQRIEIGSWRKLGSII